MLHQEEIEIKIALIGHVSVGKTTVLNALFREKYSEVSMRRTTAGVNFFRIRPKPDNERCKADDASSVVSESAEATCPPWSSLFNDEIRASDSTLKEISADNAALRESTEVHEKCFDIEVDDMICEMRADTVLVVVDIPGINEAGSGSKYKNYVTEKWNTFDCVVLVMDGTKGVNDEEQVKFLKYAKDNLETKKYLPLIILCNKIDDPTDREQAILVDESRREVEGIFGVGDRKIALDDLLEHGKSGTKAPDSVFPVFITTSALHAFIYRTVSLMTMEQFRNFDAALIEKIGYEEVGKWNWKKLTEDERLNTAYKIVTDQELYHKRLEATFFDKFLKALSYAIGDEKNQLKLIQNQIKMSLACLAPNRGLAKELDKLYRKLSVVGGTMKDIIPTTFWLQYKELEEIVFQKFKEPLDVHCLADAMLELQDYLKLARQFGWSDEEAVAVQHMKGLVRRQLSIVFNKAEGGQNVLPATRLVDPKLRLSWDSMIYEDFNLICRSVLILSYNKIFCSAFGREMILLQMLVDELSVRRAKYAAYYAAKSQSPVSIQCNHCSRNTPRSFTDYRCSFCKICQECGSSGTCRCSFSIRAALRFTMKDGELKPENEVAFGKRFRIPVPDDLSDPVHWGHLAWLYCNFMESMSATSATAGAMKSASPMYVATVGSR